MDDSSCRNGVAGTQHAMGTRQKDYTWHKKSQYTSTQDKNCLLRMFLSLLAAQVDTFVK